MDFLTIEDVKKSLGVHRDTVMRLIKTGELKAFKIGKCWRISKEDYKDYLESAKEKAIKE